MGANIKYCPVCRTSLKRKRLNGYLRFCCPECGWTNYENPLPSVVILARNAAGEVLLIKRGVEPGKGKWALPSGFIEVEERPEQTCLRELKEETNLQGEILQLIGVYTEQTSTYGNVLIIGYKVENLRGAGMAGSDTTEVKFFPAAKIPRIPFASHRQIIKDGLSKPENPKITREVLKSKISEAVITKTELFYEGSIGIDAVIAEKTDIMAGEKVHVLNYNNGERFETYVIKEKPNSGAIVFYGPAAKKGKVGDKICVLSYVSTDAQTARSIKPKIVNLDSKNRIISSKEAAEERWERQ